MSSTDNGQYLMKRKKSLLTVISIASVFVGCASLNNVHFTLNPFELLRAEMINECKMAKATGQSSKDCDYLQTEVARRIGESNRKKVFVTFAVRDTGAKVVIS